MNLATLHLSSDVMMLSSFMGHHDDSLFCFEASSRIGLTAVQLSTGEFVLTVRTPSTFPDS